MAESSLPPPPPTHSNTPLIGGALVALLIVGAVVAWRVGATEPANDRAANDATTGAKALATVEQGAAPPAPPPPPPFADALDAEDEPSASAPANATESAGTPLGNAAQRAAAKPSGSAIKGAPPAERDGCSGTCANRVDAALNQAVRQRGAAARNCYNAALSANPTLQGKVSVKVRISPTGGACGASITSDTLGSASVASCILQKFKTGGYPKPTAGCADFEVPLSFVPSGN